MQELKQYISDLNRSIEHYGKESIGADEVLDLAETIQAALEEVRAL